MSERTHQDRKFGTRIYDAAGNVTALHGKVKLGDQVTWLGRKHGSDTNDHHFQIGQPYRVCFIYPSNGDVELQGPEPQITTRACDDEYRRSDKYQYNGLSLGDSEQESADSMRDLLEETNIVSFEPTRLKGYVRVSELCDQNFKVEVSTDALRALAHELLAVADNADCKEENLVDIRLLIEDEDKSKDHEQHPIETTLTAHLDHAHHIQMALLCMAEHDKHDLAWVKQAMSHLTLDTTLEVLVHVAVPEHYRSAINQDLMGIPGYQPFTRWGAEFRPSVPFQDQEVYRHYGYFVALIQQAAAKL